MSLMGPNDGFGGYAGVYRALFLGADGLGNVTVCVPAVTGQTPVQAMSARLDAPEPGALGWVAYEGGDPSRPVWMGAAAPITPAQQAGGVTIPTGTAGATNAWVTFLGYTGSIPGIGTSPVPLGLNVRVTGFFRNFVVSGSSVCSIRVSISNDNGSTWQVSPVVSNTVIQASPTLNRAGISNQMSYSGPVTGGMMWLVEINCADANSIFDGGFLTWELQQGAPGPQGPIGPPGGPLIVGGTAGEILTKNSSTDLDASWQLPQAVDRASSGFPNALQASGATLATVALGPFPVSGMLCGSGKMLMNSLGGTQGASWDFQLQYSINGGAFTSSATCRGVPTALNSLCIPLAPLVTVNAGDSASVKAVISASGGTSPTVNPTNDARYSRMDAWFIPYLS